MLKHRVAEAAAETRWAMPEGPGKSLRHRPWQSVGLAVVHLENLAPDLEGRSRVECVVGLIDGGRVRVGSTRRLVQSFPDADGSGARGLRVGRGLGPEDPMGRANRGTLAVAVARRFLVAWAANECAGFLDGVFGGGRRRWLRRTIDLGNLDRAANRGRGLAVPTEQEPFAAVARRYGVPGADSVDAIDRALAVGQLFLILATRVAGREGSGRHPDLSVNGLLWVSHAHGIGPSFRAGARIASARG